MDEVSQLEEAVLGSIFVLAMEVEVEVEQWTERFFTSHEPHPARSPTGKFRSIVLDFYACVHVHMNGKAVANSLLQTVFLRDEK
mmetsp:Transcript_2962/g.9079  ORF Transcript_2962/g.9079 Transcript_2962/m.9079 type:complete len:84 (+) Transcript_2962:907-1158(+)|eukprot:scaffold50669_cov26-Tisochrysis_lutea.AAC.3